jgi:GNAT superfamily N-acetyltransferase
VAASGRVALCGGLYRGRMPERAAPILRRGTPADTRACHDLLWTSATDLGRRHGTPLEGDADAWWEGIESVHRFLADHAAEWWVAKDGEELIGYARSIDRDGLFELTELFVRPGRQSSGVGRQLLEHAFPLGRGNVRSIIATTDVRATARYYAADTVARFPYFTLTGRPRSDAKPEDVTVEAAGTDPAALAAISEIERAALDFPRGTDELRWLAETRPGYVFVRRGTPIGFAFLVKGAAGPIAALHDADIPAVLGHVEALAASAGSDPLELEVPGINVTAMRHLLGRGFHIDPWMNLLMSNRPFGQFDRFIGFSPPIFL